MNSASNSDKERTSSSDIINTDPISIDHYKRLETSSLSNCTSLLNRSFVNTWWETAKKSVENHQIIISHICEEAATKNKLEEYICIENIGPFEKDLSGWKINAGSDGQNYIFPDSEVLASGDSIKIYTLRRSKYSFKSKTPLWNNRGDTGLLFNASGKEVCRFTYGQDAAEIVYISEIQYDGIQGRGEADEYAEITNYGNAIADISHWRVTAGKDQDFIFPASTLLLPGKSIRVYTNTIEPKSGGFSFGRKSAIWNNKKDSGKLYDNKENFVSELSYSDGKITVSS